METKQSNKATETVTAPDYRAMALERAVAKAKKHFGKDYEHYEVWEHDKNEITIRAWTIPDEQDETFYAYFVAKW